MNINFSNKNLTGPLRCKMGPIEMKKKGHFVPFCHREPNTCGATPGFLQCKVLHNFQIYATFFKMCGNAAIEFFFNSISGMLG